MHAEAQLTESAEVSNFNILVVDDRPENLIATKKVLKPIGVNIMEAGSGNEALSLMLRHEFAVVLLDVQMPEMDGFEVALLMREEETTKDIPIIFVTAISKEDHYVDRAAEIGAVDYIYKPINANILKSKVSVYTKLYKQRCVLKHLNNALRESNDELERFAYICSHDLQEPARLTYSFGELLCERYGDTLDTIGRKYLDYVVKNSHHMQKMIQDILAFSRVGREAVLSEEVDCAEIVSEICAAMNDDIAAGEVNICVGFLPTITSGKTMVSIVFQNLIRNAIKYQTGEKTPSIDIRASEQGRFWVFSVHDNGIGIDPKYTERVFVPFQRINSKEHYPGTGIGLSTCQKLIKLYGGSIWFESQFGEGATFFFKLPRE